MNMDKISVIVPVFNGQETIERCINSIQNQTYTNLEIIIINDGSTDATEDVLNELRNEDKRISVFTIKNSGVSNARNIGISHSTGDFITFVDADDYIADKMYAELIRAIKEYHAQIAHCSYTNVYSSGVEIPVGDTGKINVQNHDEALSFLIQGKLFAGGIWNKLYERKLFNNVGFATDISFNEDVLFNFIMFDKTVRSVYLDKAFYFYVSNEKSATHTINSVVSHEQIVEVARKIEALSENKEYSIFAKRKLAYTLIDLYRTYLLEGVKTHKKKEIKKEVKKHKEYYKSKKLRVTYYLALYFPHICTITYRIYDKLRVKKLDPVQ